MGMFGSGIRSAGFGCHGLPSVKWLGCGGLAGCCLFAMAQIYRRQRLCRFIPWLVLTLNQVGPSVFMSLPMCVSLFARGCGSIRIRRVFSAKWRAEAVISPHVQ
jgi:hypothetical protein